MGDSWRSARGAPAANAGIYSPELEAQAQQWIEAVTGEPFKGSFEDELRDGRRLCLLINEIRPGLVRKVNDSRMPFKQMENVSNFLKACRAVGVPEYSLFETVDLFELKDLGLVVKCLVSLKPEFRGLGKDCSHDRDLNRPKMFHIRQCCCFRGLPVLLNTSGTHDIHLVPYRASNLRFKIGV